MARIIGITPFLYFLFISTLYAQQKVIHDFGKPTLYELALSFYVKDSEASGVVLYERGKNSYEMVNNRLTMIKEVHRKIKVLDASKFDNATIKILTYQNDKSKEKIDKIKAITHNGQLQKYLNEDAIFTTDESENWQETKFTFPDVKDGSILEYSYRIESPFFWAFGNWDFQGELPKIYSEFVSSIPGNLSFRRSLYGNLKLAVNEVVIKNNCLDFRGSDNSASCEVSTFIMEDIPRAREEGYMLSFENYRSKLEFELEQITDFYGEKTNYTKSWDDVDREFRTEKDIGKQVKYENYFSRQLPEELLAISDDVERAKAIFYHIQQHFTWNKKYKIFSDVRVKEAYDEKVGNSAEINLTLINALNAGNLDAKILLSATRRNKIPNTLYPILTEFDNVMAYLKLGEKEYILDATDKDVRFGVIPLRALNVKGRVMDFDKGSYWTEIEPDKNNLFYLNAHLKLNDNGKVIAEVTEQFKGHTELEEKGSIRDATREKYLSDKERSISGLEITNLQISNESSIDENLKLEYNVIYEPELIGDQLYIDPFFLLPNFKENPFKAEARDFPIDFGYPIKLNYVLSLKLDPTYTVTSLPQGKIVKLPQGLGYCTAVFIQTDNLINMRFAFSIKQHSFDPNAYPIIKAYFKNMVDIQRNSLIVLSKN